MHRRLAFLVVLTVSLRAFADSSGDAEKLKDEAMVVLRANANGKVTSEEYAGCIIKLEQAQAILESANDSTSGLAQEVNSALFWARRFSNVDIIKALEKQHGGAAAVHKTEVKPEPAPAQKTADAIPEAKQFADGKAAFEAAEQFAKSHANDDYMVALRWFQMANTFSGTEYALKAVQLGREAQERSSKSAGAKTTTEKPGEQPAEVAKAIADPALENSPEMELVRKGDELAKSGQYEQAIGSYKASTRAKDTVTAESRLAHAYFRRAEQMNDELGPQFKTLEPAYQQAYKSAWVKRSTGGQTWTSFNESDPRWVEATQKYQELLRKTDEATRLYIKAEACFQAVLKLSPDNRNFDAAAYVGVSMGRRADSRFRAMDTLRKFLKDYPPGDDGQRFLYEFCKSEVDRLSKTH